MRLIITDKEQAIIDDWAKRHDDTCKLEKNALGGRGGGLGERFTYELMPCAVGMFSTLVCACGAKIEFLEDDGMVIGNPLETPADE